MFAEGETDYRFHSPVIERLFESLILEHGSHAVELGGPFNVGPVVARAPGGSRPAKVAAAASSYEILVMHRDGAGDAGREYAQHIEPVRIELLQQGAQTRLAPLIPVKETETWCLVDGDAIRHVTGSRLSDQQLSLPLPNELQRIADPKAEMNRVLALATGRTSLGHDTPEFVGLLGDAVRLDLLMQLESFRVFREALTIALTDIRAINR